MAQEPVAARPICIVYQVHEPRLQPALVLKRVVGHFICRGREGYKNQARRQPERLRTKQRVAIWP